MPTATARHRRPTRTDTIWNAYAKMATVAGALFVAFFTAGFFEINLFVAALRTVQIFWTLVTSGWTYAAIAGVLIVAKTGVTGVLRHA